MNRKVLLSSSLVSVLLLSAMFGILSVRVVAADAREKIAAAIILAYKGAAVYSSGASLEEHLRYRPNNLIQWHVISFLKQKGHKWYEVGGVQPFSHDPKLKGIYMFKKGWGGTLVRGYMMRREYPSPTLSLLKTLKKLKTFSLI